VSITILGLRRSARGQDPVMAGSVYFLVIVAIGAVLAAVTGTIFLLIPFVLIAIGFLLVPVAGALRGTRAGERSEGQGVPSTREASYEPVQEPKVP
jgi:hypothetical protein